MDEQLRTLIIQELGIEGLSEEDSNEVITTLGGLVLERIIDTVTEQLDDEQVILFEKIISEGDQVRLLEFFADNVSDFDEVLQKSSREVIEYYKQL
jgi:hypothetical protein